MNRQHDHFRHAMLVPLLIALVFAAQFNTAARGDSRQKSELLEIGRATKLQTPPPAPPNIKIISYNIRWRGGEELRQLIELFKSDSQIGHAAILGLQEVDRDKKRTGNVDTALQMAEELGMYYAWAAPPPPSKDNQPQEEETGVAILSAYPLTDIERIVLPNEGPGGRRRVALGATVNISETRVRVYSVHGEVRISNEKRLQQFQAVLDNFKERYAKIERVVIVGDFNTWAGKDVEATDKLFTAAKFSTPFANGLPTWKTFIVELKLDWLWLRNLRAINYGIDRKIELSDHWPLWTVVTLNDERAK